MPPLRSPALTAAPAPAPPQISHEFERFSSYMPDVVVQVVFGGVDIKEQKNLLKTKPPHIVVGTPGRLKAARAHPQPPAAVPPPLRAAAAVAVARPLRAAPSRARLTRCPYAPYVPYVRSQLIKDGDLNLKSVRHFVLDECDKMLEALDMRADIQEIFKKTPHDKQVMMFSATLSKEIRPVCKKFMNEPMEIYVDDETKLTLHGLVQHYIKLAEREKNRKLTDLLDALDFNQVVIFVKSVVRAAELNKLLIDCNFPSICIHRGMTQEERLEKYKAFKEGHKRILVATDLVGRGIDIERVNIVINYDMPPDADSYLHRVGRAGRFGTKGLAITFVANDEDTSILTKVQERFEVDIKELPEQIDTASYMPS